METSVALKEYEILTTDVLVVGAGAAGCLAAIEARRQQRHVTMVDKWQFGKSGSTCISDGETAAIFNPGDSAELYFTETVEGGAYMSDQQLVDILMKEQNQAVKDLEEFGVPFMRNPDGSMVLYRELGMSMPRTPHLEGGGPAFVEALKMAVKSFGVEVKQRIMVHQLLTEDGRVNGALGVDTNSGDHIAFQANATVLATGSCTAIYPWSTAWFLTTGDGYAMAYDAGAELLSMEFLEFNPVLAPKGKPIPAGGTKPLFGAGGALYNRLGERFMEKYDPARLEFTTRAILSFAIYREINEGRGPVVMDPKSIPEDKWVEMERAQGSYATNYLNRLRSLGVDYRNEPIEWFSPTILCFLGGLRINTNFESTLKGLFAGGETAGGMYGADRIGDMLTWCAVSGKRAGLSASKYGPPPTKVNRSQIDSGIRKLDAVRKRRDGVSPDEVKEKIKNLSMAIGPVRNCTDLEKMVKELKEMERNLIPQIVARNARELVAVLEASNLRLVAEMVARSALMRTETRGQHVREDYPDRDDANWLKWIALKKRKGKMSFSTIDIPFAKYPLRPQIKTI